MNPNNDFSRRNFSAFLWHAFLLAVTVTFTEINTVLPAMIIRIGGREIHIGIMTGIMVGVPLASQLLFASFLHSRALKKPFLLIGINARIIALALIAVTILSISRFSITAGLLIIYGELLLFTVSGAFAGISYVDIIGKSFSGDLRKKFFISKQFAATAGILISAVLARYILGVRDYPGNYFLLFAMASGVLLTASGGFWFLKERPAFEGKKRERITLGKTIRSIPGIVRTDSNVKNYILVSNLLGASIVLLPFYISLAKLRYSLDPALIGNLLLIQIAGMTAASFLWTRVVKKRGFKGVLYVFAGIGIILPAAAVLISKFLPLNWYYPVFALSGMALSSQKITAEAVVIEISTDDNRALYTGIFGTFNLTLALFPVIIGSVLGIVGYTSVFTAVSVCAFISIFFIRRMFCPVDRT